MRLRAGAVRNMPEELRKGVGKVGRAGCGRTRLEWAGPRRVMALL